MNYEEIKQKLGGVAVTPTTPFNEDGDGILYESHRENIVYLVDAGIPVLLPCGNTGEYYSLTDDERVRIVEATADTAGDSATVIAGAGGSTREVLQLAERYREAGADGIMLMHPTHTYVHRDGLLRYFERIAAGTDLAMVLYKRGPEVMDELLVELTEIENVVGVKYAVNDISGFSNAVDSASGDAVWSNGIAERFAPSFFLEGAEGFTSGIGTFVPELPLALMDALRNEEWNRARDLRELARPYEQLRDGTGTNSPFASANNVPAVKYGMGLAGLYGGPVREPLTTLTDEDKERAEELYGEITDRLPELM